MSGQRGCRSEGFGALGSVPDGQSESCAAAGVDALAQRGRRTAATQALLSMGHNSRPPILKIWSEGARADIPAIPDLNPNRYSRDLRAKPEKESKRGNVTNFSDKSRRRLQRDIAKIKLSEITYTSALTLPGGPKKNYTNHEFVKDCFERFQRRLASQNRFSNVSGYWKRELQKRGALHYHLLIYGLDNITLKEEFRSWLVKTWNELVCVGIDADKKEKHRWWHARNKNFQEVRNMSGYFSKYVSKDVDKDTGLEGRWWGSFNKSKLPYADELRSELSLKAAVLIHRVARKLRKIKADTAKRISDQKALKEVGSRPTEMQMFRLRNGSLRDGIRNPKRAKEILTLYEEDCALAGVRWGKAKMRGKIPIQSPIILCNAAAPKTVERLLKYAQDATGEKFDLVRHTTWTDDSFTPDPLKPVPQGRSPVNPERIRIQADFGTEFGRRSKTKLQYQVEFDD